MNRGSTPRDDRILTMILCFNEAPIHESGKLAPLVRPGGRNHRFNEAPIHESGK